MKAAVLRQIGQPLRVEEAPLPQIGPDEVLVETRTCGLCRTDLHICDGLAYKAQLPHIPGHEPAGVVVAMGKDVTGIEAGQRVVPYLFLTCGQCAYCRVGSDSQCANPKGIIGVTANGGFAEYFATPAQNLFVLPDNVPFDVGGLASCAVITAVRAFRRSRPGPNDTAVVIGVGGVGQPLLQLLNAAGVRVVAIGRSETKLKVARELGARLAFRADTPDLVRQVKDFAGGDGAQCVYDCVGSARTMSESAALVMRGGRIVVIGEEPEFPAIDTIQIAQRELKIIGSRNGSRQEMADAIRMIAAGIITPLIAQAFPLEGINEALQLVRGGQVAGRAVITIRA